MFLWSSKTRAILQHIADHPNEKRDKTGILLTDCTSNEFQFLLAVCENNGLVKSSDNCHLFELTEEGKDHLGKMSELDSRRRRQ